MLKLALVRVLALIRLKTKLLPLTRTRTLSRQHEAEPEPPNLGACAVKAIEEAVLAVVCFPICLFCHSYGVFWVFPARLLLLYGISLMTFYLCLKSRFMRCGFNSHLPQKNKVYQWYTHFAMWLCLG